MRKKIAIFCGGPSSEHEVSLNSAKTIQEHIKKDKYDPYIFFISKKLKTLLTSCDQKNDFTKLNPKIDLLENLKYLKENNFFAFLGGIHGEFAEDGRLQSLLDFFKIPYSGSDYKASALCIDKIRSSYLVTSRLNIKMPKTNFQSTKNTVNKNQNFPILVKPNELGSSVGLFICNDNNELQKVLDYSKKKLGLNHVLIQELIDNAIELSCGYLQNKNGSDVLLPPIEIRPKKSKLFDYDSKYLVGGSEEVTPPISITEKLAYKISGLTKEIHHLLGAKVYSRSDFLVKNDKIYYLETNTLPGMTATSLLPQEAMAAGIEFSELIDFIITNS